MELPNKCLLCPYSGNTKRNDTWVTVTRSLPNIISCNECREDGLHEQLSKLESVDVHVNCRKKYTKTKRIAATSKRKATDLENQFYRVPYS